jgi:bacteriorhodopsin
MAAIPLGDTLWILFADVAMILVGLFGALTDTHFKWVCSRFCFRRRDQYSPQRGAKEV